MWIQKRLRVHIQDVPVCTGTTRSCFSTVSRTRRITSVFRKRSWLVNGICRQIGTEESWIEWPEDARLEVYIVHSGASDQAQLRFDHGWCASFQCTTSHSKCRTGVCLDGRGRSRRQERSSKIDGRDNAWRRETDLGNAVVMRATTGE